MESAVTILTMIVVSFHYFSAPLEHFDGKLETGIKIYNGKNVIEQEQLEVILEGLYKNEEAVVHSGTINLRGGKKQKSYSKTERIEKTEVSFKANADVVDGGRNFVDFALTYTSPSETKKHSSAAVIENGKVLTIGSVSTRTMIVDGKKVQKKYVDVIAIRTKREGIQEKLDMLVETLAIDVLNLERRM